MLEAFKNWAKNQEFSLQDLFPTVVKKEAVSLPFRILNAVIGPKKYLEHTFLVK